MHYKKSFPAIRITVDTLDMVFLVMTGTINYRGSEAF